MSNFGWKKHNEDCIKDGLIIITTTASIVSALKTPNVTKPKASFRCHVYHETYWWNIWRGISKRLCILHKKWIKE